MIDEVERCPDGSHLAELWSLAAAVLPGGRYRLLERFMADALKAGPMAAEGHRFVNRYRMEDRIGRIACPTLVIDAMADPHAHPLGGAGCGRDQGGDAGGDRGRDGSRCRIRCPEVFAGIVLRFLTRHHHCEHREASGAQ